MILQKKTNSGDKALLDQNLFKDILEAVPDAIVIVDKESRVLLVNTKFEKVFGYARDEIVGKSHDLLVPEPAMERHRSEMEIYFLSPDERPMGIGLQLEARRRDRSVFPAEISLSPVETEDGLVVVCAIRDITERKRTEQLIRDEHEKTQHYLDMVGVIMVSIDVDQTVAMINQRGAEILGFAQDEIVGKNWFDNFIVEEDRERARDIFSKLTSGTEKTDEFFENRLVSLNGEEHRVLWHNRLMRDDNGDVRAVICSGEPASEIQRAKILERMAYHDLLTELPNRALLKDRLGQVLPLADRLGESAAVMFLDLDKFKEVNDKMGHHIGDRLLRKVAKRLSQRVRQIDTVARFGGDEFVILIPGIKSAADAAKIADSLINSIARPFTIKGFKLSVAASVGIGLFPSDDRSAESLLAKADLAMLEAKKESGNRYLFYKDLADKKFK